jgi:hypothetical protein
LGTIEKQFISGHVWGRDLPLLMVLPLLFHMKITIPPQTLAILNKIPVPPATSKALVTIHHPVSSSRTQVWQQAFLPSYLPAHSNCTAAIMVTLLLLLIIQIFNFNVGVDILIYNYMFCQLVQLLYNDTVLTFVTCNVNMKLHR